MICLEGEFANSPPADPSEAAFDPKNMTRREAAADACVWSLFVFRKEEVCFSSPLSCSHLVSLAAALKEIALV